jgi:amidase
MRRVSDEYAWLDATAQAELVRKKEVKPEELVDAALARIDELNPQLNALVTPIEPSPAHDGPFTGVPFLVKDLAVEIAGTRFTEGSRFLADNVSTHDQELAIRHRNAGLVTIGKTNTCEFGLMPTAEPVLFGPTHNPWAPGFSTNGSSGGSAAAVASGMVPMAHGNDMGGSIRYPAAWCGLFGLKPTRARVPLGPEYGDFPGGLAMEHALTRSVRDSAALLDAVAGPEPGDPYWAPPQARPYVEEARTDPGPLRIAMTTRPRGGQKLHPDYAAATRDAAELLTDLGHDVVETCPAIFDDAYTEAFGTIYGAGFPWIVEYWIRKIGREPGPDEIEPRTRAFWERGRNIPTAQYLLAMEHMQRICRKVSGFFTLFDVWMTPTLGGPPVPLGVMPGTESDPMRGNEAMGTFLMFDGELANLTGNPAMSVPLFTDSQGLPIGIHFMSAFGDEATLFRLAGQLEQARPWADRRPVVSA